MSKQWIGFLIGGAVIVTGLVWVFSGGEEETLASVLGKVNGLETYSVVVPISAQSGLGRLTRQDQPEPKQIEFEAVPCFFTRPATDRSFAKQVINYSSSRSFGADVSQALAKVGVDATSGATGTLTLDQLRTESAVGVPNPNGPCRFESGKSVHQVVTRQVVSGRLTLATTGKLEGDIKTEVPSQGATVTGTWKRSGNNSVEGANIVVAAQSTAVEVTLTTKDNDLGTRPAVGTAYDFPEGLKGVITVLQFDSGERVLTLQANAPGFGGGGPVPVGVSLCAAGEPVKLRLGQACYFWLDPGNALLSVQWNLSPDENAPRVLLRTQGYRTTFAPPPPTPEAK